MFQFQRLIYCLCLWVIITVWPMNTVKATHILGGEITYKCLGGGLFEFTIKVYRDCNGIPWSQSALALQGPHGTTNLPIMPGSPEDISPRCPGNNYLSCNPPNSANSQNQGSVARYIFRGIVDLSALGPAPPAGYTFHTTQTGNGIPCCRPTINNSDVSNGNQTLVVKMFPYRDPITNVTLTPAQLCDKSPEFATDPTAFSILNPIDTIYLQSLAFDADLDSTSFGIDFPLGTSPAAPYSYNNGYSQGNPLPGLLGPPLVSSINFPINVTTGEIVYNSRTQGTFVTVIKVSAFRCGQKIAEVYRDFSLKILPNPPVSPPVFDPSGPLGGVFSQRPPIIESPFPAIGGVPTFEGTFYAGDTIESFINVADPFPSLSGNPNDPNTWQPLQQTVNVFVRGSQLATNFPALNNCAQPPCARLQRITDNSLPPNPPAFPMGPLNYGNGTVAGFGYSGLAQSGVKLVWATDCSNLPNSLGVCGVQNSTNKFQINAFDDNCPIEGRDARVVNFNLVNVPPLSSVRLDRISISSTFDSVTVYWRNLFGGSGAILDTVTIDSIDLRNYSNQSAAFQRQKSVSRRINSFRQFRLYRQTLNRASGTPITGWTQVNSIAILNANKLVDFSSSLNLSAFDYRYRVGIVSRCDSVEFLSDSLAVSDLYYNSLSRITFPNIRPCLGDTAVAPIAHPSLIGIANASLRLTYNSDSLVYVGFNSLNTAFNGMSIIGGNGVVLMNWSVATNRTIPAGNMVNLRFRVNGSSPVGWDTVISCEFSDENLNIVPQTYSSGSITQNMQYITWNRVICEGQTFSLNGQSYSTSGTYQCRGFGPGGACDTLITLNLNVIPRQTILPAITTCSNLPYSFNGLALTSSGTFFDTLLNSLGCDSILQLNLTVNPTYNQNQSVIICAGTSFAFGGQNLTSSGNYMHTYLTSNGCDSLVYLNLTIAGGGNQVTIQSSSGTNGFCPGGGTRLSLNSNSFSNLSYRWKRNGILIAGAIYDSLYVNQAGSYQLEIEVSPTCTLLSNTMNIALLNCNRITGDLRYDNTNQTPLAGVPVHLKTLLGNIVVSDTTDSSGVYDMAGYANGNYLLDASVNYSWGGVTSTDALLVTRAFNALVTLSQLRLKAGDVNITGSTNGSDALLISRRVTGVISSFVAGNFTNNLPSLNALGNPLVANLRALSTGDVNGTYNPQPTAPTLVLDTVIAGFGSGTATVRFTSSGSGVFERGICWGTSPNPTVYGNKFVFGGSGGYGFTQVFSGSFVGNQLHYARAYARTSSGIFYSNEKTFTTPPGQPCPGVSTVTDIDGNVYQGIQIGTQCWTQSNLKVSKYRNGDNIPTGLSNSAWQGTTSGAYAIYNNDPVNDGLYGKLYNHYAVTDSRGLCPTGWHVPSDGEWNILVKYLDPNADTVCGGCWQSSTAGGALKSTATQPTPGGWNSPNTGATNSSGFTALPGGGRYDNGDFVYLTFNGYWWSSSVSSGSFAWGRYLFSYGRAISRNGTSRTFGFSVRCLKDSSSGGSSASLPTVTTTSATSITSTGATTGGNVTADGGASVTARGVAYGTVQNPSTANSTTSDSTGTGAFTSTLSGLTASTLYYVRAYATNAVGTAYGNEVGFTTLAAAPSFTCGTSTVTDVDNNTYNTVQIGTQCWTQSNLKVSKYRNGDNIPTGLNNSDWQNTTSGAYAIYNNATVNDSLYGKLYNHYAVTDSRGLCPTGWHVPSDAEWTTLTTFLGGLSVAGGKMKSTVTQPTPGGWVSPNTGATNSSGFTALPGGLRNNLGDFFDVPYNGYWWSTILLGSGAPYAGVHALYYGSSDVNRTGNNRTYGFSVRCCRD